MDHTRKATTTTLGKSHAPLRLGGNGAGARRVSTDITYATPATARNGFSYDAAGNVTTI